jgi:hypothetical protein
MENERRNVMFHACTTLTPTRKMLLRADIAAIIVAGITGQTLPGWGDWP